MSHKPRYFTYYCVDCKIEHVQPIPEGGLSPDTELPVSCGNSYPEYPSAIVAIPAARYEDAVKALKGARKCFFDGETIMVPESEAGIISLLIEQFAGSATYGQGREGEFATKASRAGVEARLIRLGWFLGDAIGPDMDQAIAQALADPEATLLAWEELADSARNLH